MLSKQVMDYQVGPLAAELEPFDVYMVDGRWRLACALLSFLHASARGANPKDTIVLIHDCYEPGVSRRPGKMRPVYRKADHLITLTNHSRGLLCVFRRNGNTTDAQLLEAREEYHLRSD
jgi:hypothetical protein